MGWFTEALLQLFMDVVLPILGIIATAIVCVLPIVPIKIILEKFFPDDKYETLRGFIILAFFAFVTMVWTVDFCHLIAEKKPFLSFKIPNYNYTIQVLNFIDNINLGNTSLAYAVRKNSFNQYKNIKAAFNDKDFESIGIFSDINEEYIKLDNKYGSKINNDYKQLYLQELKNNLNEYTDKNNNLCILRDEASSNHPIYGRGLWFVAIFGKIIPKMYFIPNRIFLYPRLALSYLYQSDINDSKESIIELTQILYRFDDICIQEKNSNSKDYKNLQMDFYKTLNKGKNKDINKYSYPVFINIYPKTIILMKKNVDNNYLCSDKRVFDYYLASLSLNMQEDPEIMHIVKDQCNYNK